MHHLCHEKKRRRQMVENEAPCSAAEELLPGNARLTISFGWWHAPSDARVSARVNKRPESRTQLKTLIVYCACTATAQRQTLCTHRADALPELVKLSRTKWLFAVKSFRALTTGGAAVAGCARFLLSVCQQH